MYGRPDAVDMAQVRLQIRAGRKIDLTYRDEHARDTQRVVWPITVGYLDAVRHLVAWCELRGDFRSFRTDRVVAARFLDERYPDRPAALRARWLKSRQSEPPCPPGTERLP
jgi:predicted DNA-binding transcriptional regulator YafY